MTRKKSQTPRPFSREAANKKRAALKAAFLAAYAKDATLKVACELTGVGRRTHYDWIAQDPAYAQAFVDAEQVATDALESEARRRATEGTTEPVFYQGQQCGSIRRYSDTLLIFLLKAKRPDQFRDRFEHTGANGGPIDVVHLYMPDNYRKGSTG
jgi:cytochrome P450